MKSGSLRTLRLMGAAGSMDNTTRSGAASAAATAAAACVAAAAAAAGIEVAMLAAWSYHGVAMSPENSAALPVHAGPRRLASVVVAAVAAAAGAGLDLVVGPAAEEVAVVFDGAGAGAAPESVAEADGGDCVAAPDLVAAAAAAAAAAEVEVAVEPAIAVVHGVGVATDVVERSVAAGNVAETVVVLDAEAANTSAAVVPAPWVFC